MRLLGSEFYEDAPALHGTAGQTHISASQNRVLLLLLAAPHTHGLGQRTQLGFSNFLEPQSKHRASGTQDVSLTTCGLTLTQVPRSRLQSWDLAGLYPKPLN